MVGHLDVPGLTAELPSSLTPAVYALLRDDYGFDGVVFTDDLGAMKAVTGRSTCRRRSSGRWPRARTWRCGRPAAGSTRCWTGSRPPGRRPAGPGRQRPRGGQGAGGQGRLFLITRGWPGRRWSACSSWMGRCTRAWLRLRVPDLLEDPRWAPPSGARTWARSSRAPPTRPSNVCSTDPRSPTWAAPGGRTYVGLASAVVERTFEPPAAARTELRRMAHNVCCMCEPPEMGATKIPSAGRDSAARTPRRPSARPGSARARSDRMDGDGPPLGRDARRAARGLAPPRAPRRPTCPCRR